MTLTQRSRHPYRRRAGLAVVAALALIGGACGDDDDDAATDDTTQETTDETTEPASGSDGDVTAFCETRVALEQEFNAEQPDVEAVTALLGDLEESASDDLADNAAGLSGALAEAAESGSDPTEDPAFADNIGAIDEFAMSECGYETVEVTSIDYAFEGVPATVPTGIVGFNLTNEGAEPHEIAILRVTDGVTTPLEELLAAPEEEAMQNLTFAGAAVAAPGGSGATFTELEAGRYAAVCFVPVGGAEDGPPHFMQGMMAEFEVA